MSSTDVSETFYLFLSLLNHSHYYYLLGNEQINCFFEAQPPPAITLENKSLEKSIQSEGNCQLSASHTCQSYLLTSISALSFTGQFPIFVSVDVSSSVPARPTDVEQSTLHTPVHLAPPLLFPPRPYSYLLLLPKIGCSPTPHLPYTGCISISLFSGTTPNNFSAFIRVITKFTMLPHGKFLLDAILLFSSILADD